MERKQQTIIRRIEDPPTRTLPERQVGGPQSGLPPDFVVGQDLAPYLIVGIDFGTTFCRVSTFANGAPTNVQPHQFRALVEDALSCQIDEKRLAHSLKHALSDDCLVKYQGSIYTASDVASAFLRGIKERIERSMEKLLAKAVISVPACFPHTQREALIQAATDAKISVLGLINEPTAAALDVCYMQNINNGRYLVISNGAYSFEASVVHIQNKLIETKAIRGSRALSGYSITLALTQAIAEQMPGVQTDQLQIAVDKAKQQFDSSNNVPISYVPISIEGKAYSLSKSDAEECLTEATNLTRDLLNGLLNDAGLKPEELDGIILSGAATKLWVLNDLLKTDFIRHQKRQIVYTGNVSAGAAIYAALLVRQAKDWVIWDAIADPVIVAQGTYLREVVSGNSPVPINGHASINPAEDGAISATILQRIIDRDDELVQVAKVSVVEKLQDGQDGGAVDLSVGVTADGKLLFTARHKSLDVNLTVRVEQPERPEQPVIILTPETEELEELAFSPGFRVAKFGQQWLVNAITEESPAAHAGLQIYDELVWIGESHVFHLGQAVPRMIAGEEGKKLNLAFSRGIINFTLELECTESNRYDDPEILKEIISDAIVKGRDRRLVQALLNYAEYCIHHAQQTEATSSLKRATQISRSEFGVKDVLYLRSLCCQVFAHLKSSEHSAEAQALCLETVRCLVHEIAEITERNELLPAEAAKHLYETAKHVASWGLFGPKSPLIKPLIRNALTIAAKQRIHESVWTEFANLLPDDADESTKATDTGKPGPRNRAWADSQADALLDSLTRIHLQKLKNLGGGLAASLNSNEKDVLDNAFVAASHYKELGDWWLPFEFLARPDAEENETMVERCKQWRIIPCSSSRLAYEVAKTILVRLVEHATQAQDPSKQALYCSMLASIYAGLEDQNEADLNTNWVRKLIEDGAKIVHTTIQNVCNTYISAGRYSQAEMFCSHQMECLNLANDRERLEYAEALCGLARVHAINGNYEPCKKSYQRLIDLFNDDEHMKFEYSVRYTEFLIRINSKEAEDVLKRTEKLGKKLGILNTRTSAAWAKQLKSKKGEKHFA